MPSIDRKQLVPVLAALALFYALCLLYFSPVLEGQQLEQHDIRGYVDARDEKIGRKIRDAEVSKVPYMIIVGEKEQELNTISVRRHGQGDLGTLPISAFVENFRAMLAEMLGH